MSDTNADKISKLEAELTQLKADEAQQNSSDDTQIRAKEAELAELNKSTPVDQSTNVANPTSNAGTVNQSTTVDPTIKPVTTQSITNQTDEQSTTPKTNTINLSNDIVPRTTEVNEGSTNAATDNPNQYQETPKKDLTSEVSSELQTSFKEYQDRTNKEVQVFAYDSNTKKADIRMEGYNARQTQQIVNSDPTITSIGRDDFRDLVRVGTDPTPIKDKYCFDINGKRVEYYD